MMPCMGERLREIAKAGAIGASQGVTVESKILLWDASHV